MSLGVGLDLVVEFEGETGGLFVREFGLLELALFADLCGWSE